MIFDENYEEETCFSWTVSKITPVKKYGLSSAKWSKFWIFGGLKQISGDPVRG